MKKMDVRVMVGVHLFLSTFVLMSSQSVLAMADDSQFRHSLPHLSPYDATYDVIHNTLFKRMVDESKKNKRNNVTWGHWDMFKDPLSEHLRDESLLSATGMYDKIKESFGTLVDLKIGMDWSDWNVLTGTYGKQNAPNDLYNALETLAIHKNRKNKYSSADDRDLDNKVHTPQTNSHVWSLDRNVSMSPLHQQKYTPSGRYLRDKSQITTALEQNRGQGSVIPFFGDWDRFDTWNQYGSNGLGYLSNFFVSDAHLAFSVGFYYKGQYYAANNVETAYQVGKCLLGGAGWSPGQIQGFMGYTPDQSKKFAKQNFTFDARLLPAMDRLMESLVCQKFMDHPVIGQKLVKDTGKADLVEGNKWKDDNWGMPYDGNTHTLGHNKLGKLLMGIRDELTKPSSVNPAVKPLVSPNQNPHHLIIPQGRSVEVMTIRDSQEGVSVNAPPVASRLWFYKDTLETENTKPAHQKQPWAVKENQKVNVTFELSNLVLNGQLFFALIDQKCNQLQAWPITVGGSMSFSYTVQNGTTFFTPLFLANNASFILKSIIVEVTDEK